VYVLGSDPQSGGTVAALVPVQLGVADGHEMQVSGNLQAGQKVIVRGNERLQPGAPVQVADAPGAAKPGSAAPLPSPARPATAPATAPPSPAKNR
jgi:membrane fusion protein (multidrug efflux system)